MKKYLNFILEKNKPTMRYYAFDWDDNILMMPTVIHMEHLIDGEWVPEDVSTEKFARVRNDKENWRPLVVDGEIAAYLEFRDFGPRGQSAFIEDMKKALENGNYGPSWDEFLNCLTKGSIFTIITARGHEPETIRKAVEYIIYNILTEEQQNEMAANLMAFQDLFLPDFDIMDDISFEDLVNGYLDECDFIGVTSPSFTKKYGGDVASPEEAKTKALDIFDDISFSVIDTSDPTIPGGIKNKI
jgi:hypothetical protein